MHSLLRLALRTRITSTAQADRYLTFVVVAACFAAVVELGNAAVSIRGGSLTDAFQIEIPAAMVLVITAGFARLRRSRASSFVLLFAGAMLMGDYVVDALNGVGFVGDRVVAIAAFAAGTVAVHTTFGRHALVRMRVDVRAVVVGSLAAMLWSIVAYFVLGIFALTLVGHGLLTAPVVVVAIAISWSGVLPGTRRPFAVVAPPALQVITVSGPDEATPLRLSA